MRIHNENTQQFIDSLATALTKDPASLEHWCCLHIKHCEESIYETRKAIIKRLKTLHTDVDCDVVLCLDKDVLFISKTMEDKQLDELANEFITAAAIDEGTVAECTLYDMFRDWHRVSELLSTKLSPSHNASAARTFHSFGEIASLEDVFLEAKKLRKARLPLHVMVVEDDPLTRRIVTNAFKENYAIISATNAQEAVANYLLHAPDIVFLDIGLPDISGFDVLHHIIETDADAYVVMFSANGYLDNVTTALSQGASGFISKPFKKEKMHHYIQDSGFHHRKQCV